MAVVINFETMKTPDVLIADATWTHASDRRRSHAAEPIKSLDDIIRIKNYLVQHQRYRDNLLFVTGITAGLRCGDLLELTYGHLLDKNGNFKPEVTVREEKTEKYHRFILTNGIRDALQLYVGNTPVNLNDYLFPSESTNDSDVLYEALSDGKRRIRHGAGGPISVRSVNRILKELINDEMKIDIQASSHTLRKTFAYQTIMTAPDRDRAIEFLQQLLGHSSQRITLRYAGITDDEVRSHYQNLDAAYNAGFDFARSSGLRYASGG